MHRTTEPLILITNDDGIASPGLRAAVQAALPLGEVFVAAPTRQWSGAGRSMPHDADGQTLPYPLEVDGRPITAYQVDATPALVVARAMHTLTPRTPDLLISGINYGENMGSDITISGTVGAALQGAVFGIPAMAVSLQTPKETHIAPSDGIDFTAASHFTRLFAQWVLQLELPFDVDVLKIDVPAAATAHTPWRLTRVSRHPYFVGAENAAKEFDYEQLPHPERTEPDSDIYALAVSRVVSVAPVSMDLTSRVDLAQMEALLHSSTMR
jgi:5'-nucleotidase